MQTDHTRRYLTPPEYAERLGIKPTKVLGWITSGELLALNTAGRGSTRPRWRISPDAIADFELRRVAKPKRSATRCRRRSDRDQEYVEYV